MSSSTTAASVLREIFGQLPVGFAFRLWDDTTVALGTGAARFTVVVHTPQTFRRLIRDPTPLTFAEAFVESAIDIDGDILAAMEVANVVEDLKVPLGVRLRLLGRLWAG